jgi:hypothetical protein
MSQAPIPFANVQESGYDELGGASPGAFNVVVDGRGVVRKRPGIAASSLVTSDVVDANGLVGVYVTYGGDVFAVGDSVGERPIYRITTASAVVLGGGAPPTGQYGNQRVVFAETEMLLLLAGGRDIQKVELATLNSARLGGPPPQSSHVIALSNRLLANDNLADKTKVRFSDIALGTTDYSNHEVWSLGGVGTSGYVTAEARPDNVVALAENTGEAFVFGTTTLQTFAPDAESVFAPLSTLELGCGAPYSIVKDDQAFHWVDSKRRIVKSDGRSYSVVSDGIQKTLDDIVVTSDAYGFQVKDGFLDVVGMKFDTDGRTFVYQKDVGWGQWAGWSGGNWAPLSLAASCISPLDGTCMVATTAGKVGRFSLDATTDFDDPIVARITTGYVNRDTSSQKLCNWITLALRRGDSGSTPGPHAYLRWRDRPGEWAGEIPIDLGASGDREIVLTFHGLGVYRYRQWQFEFSGTGQVSLVSATEEFTVLTV